VTQFTYLKLGLQTAACSSASQVKVKSHSTVFATQQCNYCEERGSATYPVCCHQFVILPAFSMIRGC